MSDDLSRPSEAEQWAQEARRRVAEAQGQEPTITAFGRQFTAAEFFDFIIDFGAMGRMWNNYNGETLEDLLRRFGAERAKAGAEMEELIERNQTP